MTEKRLISIEIRYHSWHRNTVPRDLPFVGPSIRERHNGSDLILVSDGRNRGIQVRPNLNTGHIFERWEGMRLTARKSKDY